MRAQRYYCYAARSIALVYRAQWIGWMCVFSPVANSILKSIDKTSYPPAFLPPLLFIGGGLRAAFTPLPTLRFASSCRSRCLSLSLTRSFALVCYGN